MGTMFLVALGGSSCYVLTDVEIQVRRAVDEYTTTEASAVGSLVSTFGERLRSRFSSFSITFLGDDFATRITVMCRTPKFGWRVAGPL